MSHRYRVAFRELLCGRKRGYYQNNGLCRDQSSFRETTVVTAASGYESSHLVSFLYFHHISLLFFYLVLF